MPRWRTAGRRRCRSRRAPWSWASTGRPGRRADPTCCPRSRPRAPKRRLDRQTGRSLWARCP
ncbi:MAG TPA: hypothetical protein DEQ47_11100 [Solibacterales bacterium]|nr:hypothetical protein [Bryobacterales bacterium]